MKRFHIAYWLRNNQTKINIYSKLIIIFYLEKNSPFFNIYYFFIKMILNNRKSGSIRRAQALIAIICYIFIFFISNSINEAASIAIDQYPIGTLKICFQIFKSLHLVASCLFLVLVFTTFYEHWHSRIFFCVSNLLLYLTSEAFVFK